MPTWGYNLWRALTFFLPRPRVPIALLEDVSGYVKPGMNVLLLGPPGAGKTTCTIACSSLYIKDSVPECLCNCSLAIA